MFDKNKKLAVDDPDLDLALGRHITVEYYDCAPDALLDKDRVETVLREAALQSGATVVSSSFHQFDPQGVSGVVIIAESHFTVHAWPEHDYAAVDIFTCADTIDLDIAVQSIKAQFAARKVVISSDQNRGLLGPGGRSHRVYNGKKLMGEQIRPISWTKLYQESAARALSTAVDLFGCDPDRIKDPGCMQNFVKEVCPTLGVVPQENAPLIHFDTNRTGAGFFWAQSIESAGISGRFVHADCTAYLDIFSCTQYEPRELAEFALSAFQGRHYKMRVTLR